MQSPVPLQLPVLFWFTPFPSPLPLPENTVEELAEAEAGFVWAP
jgi:hypothetical protein